jgi:hypothetical protein
MSSIPMPVENERHSRNDVCRPCCDLRRRQLPYYRETVDLAPGRSKQIHLSGIPTTRDLAGQSSSLFPDGSLHQCPDAAQFVEEGENEDGQKWFLFLQHLGPVQRHGHGRRCLLLRQHRQKEAPRGLYTSMKLRSMQGRFLLTRHCNSNLSCGSERVLQLFGPI